MEEAKSIPHTPTKKWLLDWQPDGHLEREMLLGFDLSKRSSLCGADLLQNCDLPPPLKLFSPVEQGDKKAARSEGCCVAGGEVDRWDGDENPSLSRALRLSQTRAREAEKRLSQEHSRNQDLVGLLLADSLRLSAYRRWVELLEVEVSVLQKRILRPAQGGELGDEGSDPAAAMSWWCTLALSLGIVGVGFASPRFVEMAGCTSSAMGVLLLFLLCCTMWTASATDHTVGGSTGWANGVDYTKWTSGKTFVAGDSISKM
ncbi:hypothetical protein BHE74_00055711 [Ensete ventricosum]|nr:hypothetical protein BHE74_00055711 [Ensete ventricosum]